MNSADTRTQSPSEVDEGTGDTHRSPAVTLLDGPLGTELEAQGHATPPPAWTAEVLLRAPQAVARVHAAWAAAGARVHTTATFRTTERALRAHPDKPDWRALTRHAVRLCRDAVPRDQLVAGSMAPLEDCYEPARTPDDAALAREHAALAGELAEAGVDLLLVETMPTLRELRAAVAAAVATGRPCWAAITLGPHGDFFDAAGVDEAAKLAREEGAEAFLLNCCAPALVEPQLLRLSANSARPERLGAYANTLFGEASPQDYLTLARAWVVAGASIVGGCCGCTPAHLQALRDQLSGAGSA
ncbi:MAG: homocysteine S-methyltransferase [Planctomycetota bacterium]|nr:MAG: homocysteine S-methyltransferase [Planctomycetota bacterium]